MKTFAISVPSNLMDYAVSPNTKFVTIAIEDRNANGQIDAGDNLHVSLGSLDDGESKVGSAAITAEHAQTALQLGQLINGTLRQSGITNKMVVSTKDDDLVVVALMGDAAMEQVLIDL